LKATENEAGGSTIDLGRSKKVFVGSVNRTKDALKVIRASQMAAVCGWQRATDQLFTQNYGDEFRTAAFMFD